MGRNTIFVQTALIMLGETNMWLMTKHGFYSIVQKKPDEYHVRARERQDLQNLIDRVPLPDAVIIDTPEADYAAAGAVLRDASG